MKQLMLGNAAVARGLYEAGCCVISSYPGTPSTEITEEAAKFDDIYCEWAPNEKVATEVAYGASVAGSRSFCTMKMVGLNVAADPLFTMSYTGVNGGMVIGVADDAGMHSSQNEQDSRHYARAAKVPMLEPSDSAEALAFAKLAYELSEQFDTPVLLKMCTRVAHSQSLVEPHDRVERPCVPYEKNIAKYVMMPGNAIRRHPFVEERTRKLQEWAETAPINRVEMGGTKMGIITSSTSYQYVKEVCGDRFPVLKLGMAWPLPEGLIRCDEYGNPVSSMDDRSEEETQKSSGFNGTGTDCTNIDCGVAVTVHTSCNPFISTTQVVPKCLTLGMGCRKDKDARGIAEAAQKVLDRSGFHKEAFEQIASIDLKKEEKGILSLSQDWQIPFVTYTEEELKQVPGEFTPSPFVKKITGVDNVCERSAVLASGNGRLLQRKTGENGVTTAVAAREWRIHFE